MNCQPSRPEASSKNTRFLCEFLLDTALFMVYNSTVSVQGMARKPNPTALKVYMKFDG